MTPPTQPPTPPQLVRASPIEKCTALQVAVLTDAVVKLRSAVLLLVDAIGDLGDQPTSDDEEYTEEE